MTSPVASVVASPLDFATSSYLRPVVHRRMPRAMPSALRTQRADLDTRLDVDHGAWRFVRRRVSRRIAQADAHAAARLAVFVDRQDVERLGAGEQRLDGGARGVDAR